MAVLAVQSEPLSGSNSLLTGKNTGKFANFVPEFFGIVLYGTESTRFPVTQLRDLNRTEQGIITHLTGNINSLFAQRRSQAFAGGCPCDSIANLNNYKIANAPADGGNTTEVIAVAAPR